MARLHHICTLLLVCTSGTATLAQEPDEVHWRADPRLTPPEPPASWQEFEDRFIAGGETPAQPPESVTMLETEVLRRAFAVQSGACYTVGALGSGLEDVDLEVTLGGERVALDVWPDPYPAVSFCASASGQAEVAVTAFIGSGEVTWQWYLQPASGPALGAFDEVTNRLFDLRRHAAPWAPEIVPQWRHVFRRPGYQDVPYELAAGQCVATLLVAEGTILEVDLAIVDSEGIALTGDYGNGANGVALWCTEQDVTLRTRVLALRGQGTVGVQWIEFPAR
jgi:hypothetical protein